MNLINKKCHYCKQEYEYYPDEDNTTQVWFCCEECMINYQNKAENRNKTQEIDF